MNILPRLNILNCRVIIPVPIIPFFNTENIFSFILVVILFITDCILPRHKTHPSSLQLPHFSKFHKTPEFQRFLCYSHLPRGELSPLQIQYFVSKTQKYRFKYAQISIFRHILVYNTFYLYQQAFIFVGIIIVRYASVIRRDRVQHFCARIGSGLLARFNRNTHENNRDITALPAPLHGRADALTITDRPITGR